MVLKRHKDKSWEWKDNECFSNEVKPGECDGVMELKDVTLKGGSMFTEAPYPVKYTPPILEKTWVCNKCGFVFVE